MKIVNTVRVFINENPIDKRRWLIITVVKINIKGV
jgi:hypothetical protein